MNTELIEKALNELGLALISHNHQWSDELRKLYEDAINSIKGNNNSQLNSNAPLILEKNSCVS